MTEQDFRDKFSSILSKAVKLEMDHPQDWGVATVVSIALGSTVSILSAVGCVVDINDGNKMFILNHGIKVDFDYSGGRPVGSRCISHLSPEYAYQRLTNIDNGLDSVDKAMSLARDLDREFTQNGWNKNWE